MCCGELLLRTAGVDGSVRFGLGSVLPHHPFHRPLACPFVLAEVCSCCTVVR